ncbi:hypothetical protein scyTo_0020552, partial [Scyliorhinus torazame]|nr:hypothetical protein [Scyliorhinus torazame]
HFLTEQNQADGEPLSQNVPESLYQSQSIQHQVEVEDEEKQHFAALMERLGANTILQDNLEIWKLWVQLRRNEPNLLGNLEDFLSKVTFQMQEAQIEKEDLERRLKKRMAEHNTDVQRLSEEMELQIKNEKERFENENIAKLYAQSQELQKELDSKQEEVQNLVQAQAQKKARQRWGSEPSQGDARSEGRLQGNWENTGHMSRIISIEEEPLPLQAREDSGIQSLRVTGQEVDMKTVKDGDAVFEEKAEALLSDGAAGLTQE